jgi:hypothetical protein
MTALDDIAKGDPAFDVVLAKSGRTYRVPAEKSILDVLIDAGGREADADLRFARQNAAPDDRSVNRRSHEAL